MAVTATIQDYDFTNAAHYHTDAFPPAQLDHERLHRALGQASMALGRYDARLQGLHNKDLLLAPLQQTEAIISSRIEGTVATLEEVLRVQADADDTDSQEEDGNRLEAIEVFSYTRALRFAQNLIRQGLPISSRLLRETHSRLLFMGRGADKTPGEFKTEPNYVVDRARKRVLFVPIEPARLEKGIHNLELYLNEPTLDVLIQTAVGHIEFEALHPFKDGNGRLGRMLIPLNLWEKKAISGPHFYVSAYFEKNRDEYIERLRLVSADGQWTEWVLFFLEAIIEQAARNIEICNSISSLYERMKEEFRSALGSQWSITALDFVFSKGMFRNSSFTSQAGIPAQTAHRIGRKLVEANLLQTVIPASGQRAALYQFGQLLDLVSA